MAFAFARAPAAWKKAVLVTTVLFAWAHAFAAQVPPAPNRYFNDYANLVGPEIAARLNARLEAFERETSNQILVAIFPNLPPDTDVFTYAVDVFRAWKPGQAGRDNGAILFVFVRDRKIWIQTGRGLEGALPDAICKRITADEMAPAFKAGHYDAGIEAGINAMIAATRGEYRGTGKTHADATRRGDDGSLGFGTVVFLLILLFIIFQFSRRRRFGYGGRGPNGGGGVWIFPSGGGGGSAGGGGSSSGDSGGGFSGGGGDTGGGGSGSDW
ncbi:MAG: TPM domain-containing protein [Verrucomicrobia bacterium]|nr:TPM domain-containing protein [Verrucomicrobiota bacterium]